MNITKKPDGSTLLFEIEGNIDSLTAPELDDAIGSSVEGVTTLILDFTKVDYVSSAGLRVLLVAYRKMSEQGEMIIRHPNTNVMDIFTMTGFDNIFTIEQ